MQHGRAHAHGTAHSNRAAVAYIRGRQCHSRAQERFDASQVEERTWDSLAQESCVHADDAACAQEQVLHGRAVNAPSSQSAQVCQPSMHTQRRRLQRGQGNQRCRPAWRSSVGAVNVQRTRPATTRKMPLPECGTPPPLWPSGTLGASQMTCPARQAWGSPRCAGAKLPHSVRFAEPWSRGPAGRKTRTPPP